MGSTSEDLEDVLKTFPIAPRRFFEDEYPAHRVQISKPFYMSATEVTLGQFLKFYHAAKHRCECERDQLGGFGFDGKMFESQKREYSPWNWGHADQTMDHPVVNVTWNDAVAFCEWLSRQEGVRYRLPTDAEWEYACRAGTTTRYYHGQDPERLVSVGNVADQSAKQVFAWPSTIAARDGYVLTAPVGRFQPNAFGLYDMHGNVSEWCADWYDPDAYRSRTGLTVDPIATGGEHKLRSHRGGSWGNGVWNPLCSNRLMAAPSERKCNCGFRVVMEP